MSDKEAGYTVPPSMSGAQPARMVGGQRVGDPKPHPDRSNDVVAKTSLTEGMGTPSAGSSVIHSAAADLNAPTRPTSHDQKLFDKSHEPTREHHTDKVAHRGNDARAHHNIQQPR